MFTIRIPMGVAIIAASFQLQASPLIEGSKVFLGSPYTSNKQDLLKRLSNGPEFDCQTFVEATLSLALSSDESTYYQNLNKLRYFPGETTEANRKHFISTDWLPPLLKKAILIDITREIFPRASTKKVSIDKLSWFKRSKRPLDYDSFRDSSLKKLEQGSLAFIPFHRLRKEDFKTSQLFPGAKGKGLILRKRVAGLKPLAARIPSGSVLVFVNRHPNKFIKKIGSPLLVGHIGIAIQKNGHLHLRHADLPRDTVMDIPMESFIRSNSHKYQGMAVLRFNESNGGL